MQRLSSVGSITPTKFADPLSYAPARRGELSDTACNHVHDPNISTASHLDPILESSRIRRGGKIYFLEFEGIFLANRGIVKDDGRFVDGTIFGWKFLSRIDMMICFERSRNAKGEDHKIDGKEFLGENWIIHATVCSS